MMSLQIISIGIANGLLMACISWGARKVSVLIRSQDSLRPIDLIDVTLFSAAAFWLGIVASH